MIDGSVTHIPYAQRRERRAHERGRGRERWVGSGCARRAASLRLGRAAASAGAHREGRSRPPRAPSLTAAHTSRVRERVRRVAGRAGAGAADAGPQLHRGGGRERHTRRRPPRLPHPPLTSGSGPSRPAFAAARPPVRVTGRPSAKQPDLRCQMWPVRVASVLVASSKCRCGPVAATVILPVIAARFTGRQTAAASGLGGPRTRLRVGLGRGCHGLWPRSR